MRLDIRNFIESAWLTAEKNQCVKVWYKPTKGNNLKAFTFPRFIEIDKQFAEACGLYIGDGKITDNDLSHAAYASKDLELASKVMKFFRRLGIDSKDITLTLSFRKRADPYFITMVKKELALDKFRIVVSDRYRYPTINVQTNGRIFRILLKRLLLASFSEIKKDSILRRAWLSGYFAAEGTVGYQSTENYIAYIGFAYNPNSEIWLRDYCIECLRLEGIDTTKVTIRHTEHVGSTMITNWRNYYRMWKIGLFGSCERKQKRFVEIFTNMQVTCLISDEIRAKLFAGNQYGIAKHLKTYQATISNMKTASKRNIWPNTQQIKKLCKLNSISLDDVKKNIVKVRFGPVTTFEPTTEILDDIFNR